MEGLLSGEGKLTGFLKGDGSEHRRSQASGPSERSTALRTRLKRHAL